MRCLDSDPFKGSASELAQWMGVSRRTVFNLRRGRYPEEKSVRGLA